MSRSSQSQSAPHPTGRRRSRSADRTPGLRELAARFARFRQQHQRGARVPKDLRAAALAALQNGSTPGDLYRSCGISWSQVTAWKAGDLTPSSVRAAPAQLARGTKARKARNRASRPSRTADARVFTVTEAPQPGSLGQELELRLGPWAVSVRVAEPGHTGRG